MLGGEQKGRRRGGRGGSCPPTFESWGAQPLQFFTSTHAPFLTRPPSSQLAPTPLVRESQDNPGTAIVTLVYRDTPPQGCWGVRESQDNPGTDSVTPVYRDTLPQGCWEVRESQDNPRTTGVTLAIQTLCHRGGGEGYPWIIPGLLV